MCKMLDHFKEMEDYRQAWKVRHKLIDIIVIIICAVVSGAENMAIIRHLALNLMKSDPSVKLSLKQMKKKLEWDHDYVMSLIFGNLQG